jgi:biotin carboxylase
MEKLILLGTNYYQTDLVKKAKEMGYETHLFGIGTGGPMQQYLGTAAIQHSDHYYPISIYEPEKILEKANEINPVGVVSIAADITVPTWNYVAENLGLVCNGISTSAITTNKIAMKKRFVEKGIPTSEAFIFEHVEKTLWNGNPDIIEFPVIVKSVDRAGKYGITKVDSIGELPDALEYALGESYSSNKVLVEEFVDGKEYSAECISYNGEHTLLTFTEKWSGPPHFVEEMHLQPMSFYVNEKGYRTYGKTGGYTNIIFDALTALGIKFGASHTEFKINSKGEMKIIEIGARMSAENMWDLVQLTTGVDYVKAVIDIAVGKKPDLTIKRTGKYAFVKYLMSEKDFENFEKIKDKVYRTSYHIESFDGREITKNQHRYGFYIMQCDSREEALKISQMP